MTEYTLTIVEYDEDDEPHHTTLFTCHNKAEMIERAGRYEDDLYQCYVTVTDFGGEDDLDGSGYIVEQEVASDWIAVERKLAANAVLSNRGG